MNVSDARRDSQSIRAEHRHNVQVLSTICEFFRIPSLGENGGTAEFLLRRDRLIPACHWLRGTRRQTHVNDEVQTFSDLSVEILRARIILSDVRTRIFGKTGALQECSRALGAAIGFTWCRHSTIFILHQWRPVGVEYSFNNWGKSSRNTFVDADASIPPPFCPLPSAGGSKTRVAWCEARLIIGGP